MINLCVDAGTINCPCPMAETGDCLICSRLAGSEKCDCQWMGVCIYNEFVQNDRKVRNTRHNFKAKILSRKFYGDDVLMMELDVPKGFALQALHPGSFIFMKPVGESDYYNTPISVMEANHDEGTISVVIKVVSSKTKKIASAEDYIEIRGVYRNGLIGGGARQLVQDKKNGAKWLIIAKGIALAPAVKLVNWAGDNIDVDLIIDPDKINDEIIRDFLVVPAMQISFLTDLELFDEEMTSGYDRVIILTSNYFIKTIKTQLKIPDVKLVYCNNFNMCCGEGICGACVYTDENGNSYKTCKCNLNG